MLSGDSGHLSFRDIAALLQPGAAVPEAVRAHAEECMGCGEMVRRLRAMLDTLKTEAKDAGREVTRQHLSTQQTALLASGYEGENAAERMEHVFGCDACGEELLEAVRLLNAPLTRAEGRLARSIGRPPNRFPKGWLTLAVAACIILMAGTGIWYVVAVRHSPDRLLAEAYTRQRLIDFRLHDAGYAAVARSRGSAATRPTQLIQAEADLTGKFEGGAASPRTLRLLGVADLESLRAGDAVDHLEQARKSNSKDAEVLAELGAAYALRGEMEQRTEDYARALEYLGQALQRAPDSLAARFNRALTLERLNLLEDAAAEWDEYLKRDPSSRWAAEARERREAVGKRVEPHAARWRLLAGGPEGLLDPEAREISPDLYLEGAIFRWLSGPLTEQELGAVRGIADDLADRHGDEWLRDSLREAPAGDRLWRQLRAVVEANSTGDANAAQFARVLREAALAAHATTLAKRADFEEAWALDRTQQSKPCLDLTRAVLDREVHSRFAWLQAALRSEEVNCLALAGDAQHADVALGEAVKIAAANGLAGQLMRARAMRISANTNANNPWFTFAEAPDYLATYWQDGFRPTRLDQVSLNLATASQFLGYPHAASAFGEAAVRAIAQMGDRRVEAGTRMRFSAMALAAGQTALAKEESARASAFFAHDADPRTAAYRDDAVLTAADADLTEGDFASLQRRLQAFERRDTPPATFLLDLRLRRLEAGAAMHAHDWARAYQALDRALTELHRQAPTAAEPQKWAAFFEQAAPLYRMRTEALLDQGLTDRALESALELYSLSPGASQSLRPRPNETWLIYMCLPTRIAVWTVTAQAREFRWARGTRQELAARIEQFRDLAASPHGQLLAAGKALFADLAPLPAQQLTEGRRLVIVPDEEIAMLPFPALPGPDGKPLGLTVELARTHRLPAPEPPAGLSAPGLLLLAASGVDRPGLKLPPLPEVATEARDVAGGQQVGEISGQRLTPEAIAAAAPSASWVHFAGHGYSNGGNGALFLSGAAAPLTSTQIIKMDLHRCRLAVLSACWTASGESKAFANPESLVEAFLLAGAQGVVAPAWTIDSNATVVWMREFYSALRAGAAPPAAMRAASRFLAAQPAFESPYYWAGFQYFM